MAVAAEPQLRIEPSLEEARALAAEGNVVPVRARFVDDCETPVSAFLKLHAGEPEGAPCFLLEAAEQGRGGRYSFVGIRPRSVLRWDDGKLTEDDGPGIEAPDPYGAVAEHLAGYRPAPFEGLPPFGGGAVGFFGSGPVRPGRLLRLRPRPPRRAPGRTEPRPARPAGHGADDHRRDARLRPPQARADDPFV